ncbi:hypothetical protein GXW82_44305 [Streptacidiphilus sp. 4-A2]|nr:hypothetical protein [Streptacidiphilus sp. 4-A2]
MPHSHTAEILASLVLSVALLFALLAGAAAGAVSRMGGASTPSAVLRAGAACAGALTVILAMLTLLTTWFG